MSFTTFKIWIIFHCLYTLQFVYPFSVDGHRSFPPFGYYEYCCNEYWCTSIWAVFFISFGSVPRSAIAGSHGDSMFKFLRNCQTIFHCGWTTLYPHQQYTGVQFLFILTNVCCFLFFFFNRPSGSEIVSHYGFDLCFPDD